MTPAGRSSLAAVAAVLASIAMLATLLAYYADHVLVSPAGFSARAVSVVRSGAVEGLIVDSVTGRVLAEVGNQPSVRPIVASAVRDALSNGRITAEVRGVSAALHSELESGTARTLTLTLPDLGSTIAASVQPASPQLAALISHIGTITVVDVAIPPAASGAIHRLASVGRDDWLLLILTVALALLALVVSANRRRTLVLLGMGALAGGLLAAAAYIAGRSIVVGQFSAADVRAAAAAAWSAYFGGLELAGFALAAVGAVAATIAAVFMSRGEPRNRFR